ncbi:ABC transporter ATP-binding protein [Variovorax ureilyticus]|uniref:ABC transporter ATP-binding protein n=1 Tax=Variovorax ureilyticus TaxID=1836198 RepID=A0ABU8VNQ7_9BURK
MKNILEIHGVNAGYGSTNVLHNLTIDVAEGQVTALLGANGAGKTTTLRMISGMIERTGDVRLAGESIAALSTEAIVRKGVAHVPDGRGTFKRQTVEENLRLGAITRRPSADVRQDQEMVFDYFPILKARRMQQAGLLSGGEQQMLAVGRALMLRPKLLLLDEPSFGLAPLIVQEIFEIFRRLNREQGTSMLLVEQNAEIALNFANYAYVIETGRVVLGGTATDIKKDDQVARAYLGY